MTNPRIEDLRRRVEKDPASIAFAQLAEEYRRAGDCEEAVRVCEAGLARHPAYLSARVTLGRALFELGRLQDARTEFARVVDAAPDNLAAATKLAEIEDALGHTGGAPASADSAVRQLQPVAAAHSAPSPAAGGPSFNPALVELETWLEVIAARRSRLHR